MKASIRADAPEGWGRDDLSDFLATADHNQLATFQNRSNEFQLLRAIDDVFQRLLDNLDNPPDQLAPLFIYRAHAAFRAAVRTAVATQVPESYPLLRVALEHVLLGSYLNRHPESFDVWKDRSESPEAKKKVRNTFTTGALLADLEDRDAGLHVAVKALYEESIDMGSHPTDIGVFSNIVTSEDERDVHIDIQYFSGDGPQLQYLLRFAARVGVAVLKIACVIFPERCKLLSVWDSTAQLAAEAAKPAA